jgi:hypothetical protein
VEKGLLVVGIVHQAEDQAQAVVPRVGGRRKGGREGGREGGGGSETTDRWWDCCQVSKCETFRLPPSLLPSLSPSLLSHRRNSFTR